MKVILHFPYKIHFDHPSGSNIRPVKIKNAFQKIGCEIEVIWGYARERTTKIKDLKKRITAGEKFDLLYSESSTMPTLLTEKNHFPLHPFLDFGFFAFCKKNGIPIGLFYRDIHWNFEQYELNRTKKKITRFFYLYDLKKYNQLIDCIFLPSIEMQQYVPVLSTQKKIRELPPGIDYSPFETEGFKSQESALKILYVGGIGKLYQMHELTNAANSLDKIALNICTRKEEWEREQENYNEVSSSKNIHTVHLEGEKLDDFAKKHQLASLLVYPTAYWKFAMPLKLFYYLSQHLPVIASKGSKAAKFVEENNVGWTVNYDKAAIQELLIYLQNNPDEIEKKVSTVQQVISKHTWENRAQQIIKTLVE